MPRRSLYILLPVLGALAAVLAFAVASPFEATLDKPGVPPEDPAAHYSTGTLWDIVEHVTFGAVLIGSFAFAIRFVEQGASKGLPAGLTGAAVGAVVVPLANSGADLLGVLSDRTDGFRGLTGPVVWCVIVPSAIAYALAFCLGMTPQRARRALTASVIGFFACLLVQTVLSVLFAVSSFTASTSAFVPSSASPTSLRSGVPLWQAMDIAIGVTMGLLFAYAQNKVRSAWLRLVAGRNEFRDWNLDAMVSRIGTQEGIEVLVRGHAGIAPVHAEIVRQEAGFVLRDLVGATLLNGSPVQVAWLGNGDAVTVGEATLAFLTKGGPRPVRVPVAPVPHWQTVPDLTGACHEPDAAFPTAGHRLSDSFGQWHDLREGVTTVGRDPSNDLALSWDSHASRFHGEIVSDSQQVVYRDLGSSNGSELNGHPVTEARLHDGDVLRIGTTAFRYSSPSSGAQQTCRPEN